jgi:lipopolysaccharide/colanic/teichoic acid biosynthesis glycosyltransferase
MVRRLIDIFVASFCLIIFAPLLLVIAVLIKIDSWGPILYTPRMIGLHGREFFLFRFRTMPMHGNAEQKLTHVDKFIRNYSLDHLPMLFNLLNGDLTLVGPRPMETDPVNMDDLVWQKYFSVKPGLFNYAVLKLGRSWTPTRKTNSSLNQELELQYLQKRSISSDLKLFLKSIKAFLTSGGNIKARSEPDEDKRN